VFSVIESFRTFIAIELPFELRARIFAHIECLRQEMPDVRASWNRDNNLHLTLKFLGEVPSGRISQLSDHVERAAHTVVPLELIVSGCGAFPPRGKPNVLWLGITDPSGELSRLHGEIENQCDLLGLKRETRSFRPHLTIARLRRPQGASRLAEFHKQLGFAAEPFTVSEVVVFKSELLVGGSRHTALSRHELRTA
jgi:2'-5' RNA ligase